MPRHYFCARTRRNAKCTTMLSCCCGPSYREVATVGSLHTRSIHICRILVGLVTLYDIARRTVCLPILNLDVHGALELEAFNTDQGIVHPSDTPHGSPLHRIFFYRGSWILQLFIAVVHGMVTMAMIVGFRTSWSTLATWFLTICMHGRNEYVIDCGDRLMRSLLFWLMLIPPSSSKSGWLKSPATWGLHVQVAALYWCALCQRLPGRKWFIELSATWYSLHDHRFARWISQFPLLSPELCAALNVAVVFGEVVAPLLLFLPARWERLRYLAVAMLCGMQLGFGSFLRLETFPLVSLCLSIVFLPSYPWSVCERQNFQPGKNDRNPSSFVISNVVSAETTLRQRHRRSNPTDGQEPIQEADEDSVKHAPQPRTLRFWLSLFFVCYVALLNLGDIGLVSKPDNGDLGEILRINQWWVMFSPDPESTTGWPVIRGRVEARRERESKELPDVDLMLMLRNGFYPEYDVKKVQSHPSWPSSIYRSFRWQKFLTELAGPGLRVPNRRQHFAEYLCRKWRETVEPAAMLTVVSADDAETEAVVARKCTEAPCTESWSLHLKSVTMEYWMELHSPPTYTVWPFTVLNTNSALQGAQLSNRTVFGHFCPTT